MLKIPVNSIEENAKSKMILDNNELEELEKKNGKKLVKRPTKFPYMTYLKKEDLIADLISLPDPRPELKKITEKEKKEIKKWAKSKLSRKVKLVEDWRYYPFSIDLHEEVVGGVEVVLPGKGIAELSQKTIKAISCYRYKEWKRELKDWRESCSIFRTELRRIKKIYKKQFEKLRRQGILMLEVEYPPLQPYSGPSEPHGGIH